MAWFSILKNTSLCGVEEDGAYGCKGGKAV
jgi:hypothetical protein